MWVHLYRFSVRKFVKIALGSESEVLPWPMRVNLTVKPKPEKKAEHFQTNK